MRPHPGDAKGDGDGGGWFAHVERSPRRHQHAHAVLATILLIVPTCVAILLRNLEFFAIMDCEISWSRSPRGSLDTPTGSVRGRRLLDPDLSCCGCPCSTVVS